MTDRPNSVHYRRYANVARKLAKQQEGSNGLMWGQLAVLWNQVADRKGWKRSCLRKIRRTTARQSMSGAHPQLAVRVVHGHLSPK
jgi:hypothetical protein